MGPIDLFRDALFGNPPSPMHEPSREGSLAAFDALYRAAVIAQYAATSGLNTVPTITARDTFYATESNRGKLVYVNNNNGSPLDPANGVYEFVDGAPRLANTFYRGVATIVEPLTDRAEAAAEQAAQASQASLSELGTRSYAIYPTSPVPDGVAAAGTGHYVWETTQGRGRALSVEIYAAAAGTFELGSYRKAASGQITRQSFVSVAVPSAGRHVIPVALEKASDDYLGFRQTSGVVEYSNGSDATGGWWFGATLPFMADAKTDTFPVSLRIEFVELDRLPDIEGQIAEIEGAIYQDASLTLGRVTPIPAPTLALDNGLYALETPAAFAGKLTKISLNASSAGTVRVIVFSRSGDTFTAAREQTVAVSAGSGEYPLNLAIAAGQHVGFQAPGIVGVDNAAVGPGQGYFSGVGVNVLIDPAPSNSPRLLIGFELDYRALARDVGGSRPAAIGLAWENMFIPCQGQSLMEGTKTPDNTEAPISTVQEYDDACFAAYPASPSSILPATVANSQRTHPTLGARGEWPGLGGASALRRAIARDHNITHLTLPNRVIVANNALSSQTIEQISKGSAMYAQAVLQAGAVGALTSKSFGVPAVWYGQGESDGPGYADTDPIVYASRLKQFAADIDADIRAATGQSQRVPTVAYQVCSSVNRPIGLAQTKAAIESDLLYIACPMYQFDYYDFLHINAASSRHLGGYYGEATAAIMAGKAWEPLQPVSAHVLGSTVTLTFNKSGLAIDTALVPEQAGKGFYATAADGTTAIAVSNVEVVNGNQVRLTLASAPAPGMTVSYGVPAVGIPEYGGGAGNLRDAAGDIRKIDGLPLHNWCVLFDWKL